MATKLRKDPATQVFKEVSTPNVITLYPSDKYMKRNSFYRKERFVEGAPFSPKEKY